MEIASFVSCAWINIEEIEKIVRREKNPTQWESGYFFLFEPIFLKILRLWSQAKGLF